MRIIACSLFILSVGCVSAQTRLSTPVVILPKADRSAAGVVQLLDSTGANPFPISQSSPHLITFGSTQHLVWDDTNGVLGITTNGSSTNGMIITSVAGNNAGIYLLDGATYKWGIQKNSTNLDFTLFDAVTSAFVMDIASGRAMKLEPATDVDLLPGSGLTAATGEVTITQAGGGQAFSVSAVGALAATINNANGAALNLIGGGSGTSRTTLIVSNTGSAPGINVAGGSGGHSIDIASGDIAPTTDGTTNVGESNLEFDFLYGKILGLGAMTMQPWSGTPNGFVAAPIGSITADISGSAPWYKSTSGGTSGWVQLGSGSPGVTSLSPGALTGAVTLAGGTGILVQHLSGSTITISPNTATTCSSAFTDCMTTDTSQTVTGLKTWGVSQAFTIDNTWNVGSSATRLANIYAATEMESPQFRVDFRAGGIVSDYFDITAGPNVVGSFLIKDSSTNVILAYSNNGGSGDPQWKSRGSFTPASNNTYNLGSSSLNWSNVYGTTVNATSVSTSFITGFTAQGNILPTPTNSLNMGGTSNIWANVYSTSVFTDNLHAGIGSQINVFNDFIPNSNNSFFLGGPSNYWQNGYITNIFAGGIQTGTIEATAGYLGPGLVPGVTCAGAPTALFATSVGIVTHC